MDSQQVKTSLSAGLLIRDVLTQNSGVGALTNRVFPVVSEADATLPYIQYRRVGFTEETSKANARLQGAETSIIEVNCFAGTYAGSVDLAERVRNALDCTQHSSNGLFARSIVLTDAEEAWEDDAYIQVLTFQIKVQ